MKLITKLEVHDFRSLSRLALTIPSSYLPIVGVNNSGKSNLLRTLNLFFNEETEPGRALNLREDFHNPSRKKKKRIMITVHFNLPGSFHIQQTVRAGIEELLGQQFAIRKTWSIPEDPTERGVKVEYYKGESGDFIPADTQAEVRIRQFLSLIRFRYLPNYIHPSEILRREQSAIQGELLGKLARSKKIKQDQLSGLFIELGTLSSELARPITEDLKKAAEDIEAVDLSTPSKLGQLLFNFGLRLKVSQGETFDALLHGSGIQSFLTFLILKYLDSRFSLRFGWHQATVWAIEEPESFLHQNLEARVADILSTTSLDDMSRFQIFCTTHSDVFVRSATHGVICRLVGGKTDARIEEARPLVSEAAKLGISPYVHPILYGAHKPLLIAEGPSDRTLIEYAYSILVITCPWEIQDIEAIATGSGLSGIDGLVAYLKANRSAINTRPLKAPLFVLVDWNESSDKVDKLKDVLRVHPTSDVIQWDASHANPNLDQTFSGIEHFLSTEVVKLAASQNLLELRRPANSDFPLSLVRRSMKKVEFAKFVVSRGEEKDVNRFKNQLENLNRSLAISHRKALQAESGNLFQED